MPVFMIFVENWNSVDINAYIGRYKNMHIHRWVSMCVTAACLFRQKLRHAGLPSVSAHILHNIPRYTAIAFIRKVCD